MANSRPQFRIERVQFRKDITLTVGGQRSQIDAWIREKHADICTCEESGPWIVISTRDGRRRRVPMSSVAFIQEEPNLEDDER